ncbi:MAG: hypothetical protein JXR31_09165 [Prolixibacteraceae bacterium]|nr:hypothetical protein [Prolixibacteraceae bacterium]MBN2774403.1 hypothetical protein [Prolixibacteraceae bacterium]
MNKIVPLFLTLLFFAFSCGNNESEDDLLNEELPVWLSEIVNSNEECYSCFVTKYSYNNNFYYHYYCGYWSCSHCRIYNDKGELVYGTIDLADFLENSSEIGIIWQCPGD